MFKLVICCKKRIYAQKIKQFLSTQDSRVEMVVAHPLEGVWSDHGEAASVVVHANESAYRVLCSAAWSANARKRDTWEFLQAAVALRIFSLLHLSSVILH